MKVAIFNVKYSPNLGDGVVALCLEREIRRRTGWEVVSIDLAGRTQFADPGGGMLRLLMLAALQRLPRRLRDVAVGLALGGLVKSRLRRRWEEMLSNTRFVVFGGGQLFQDGDLNFPIKLAAAVSLCEREKLPLALFAVGAAPSRSARGRRLMRRVAASPQIVHAATRDAQSCAALEDLGRKAGICRDPGLLAAGVWPAPPRGPRARPLVGLGLTHPAVLAHHASCGDSGSLEHAIAIYSDIARSVCAAGCDVLCFTNGAGEDERLLAALRQEQQLAGLSATHLSFALRCRSPEDLARLAARCDAIIGHRLHASILAYAYRVPSVGLLWDDKLRAFFESVGRGKYLARFEQGTGDRMVALVNAAMVEGIDARAHAQIVQETHEALDGLVAAIAAHADASVRGARLAPGSRGPQQARGAARIAADRWMGAA